MARDAGAEIFVVDETFVDAPVPRVADVLLHPDNLAMAWPHVRLLREEPRDEGERGLVSAWRTSGVIEGRFELWFEGFWEGTIVHHYVRGRVPGGAVRRVERAHVGRWKRHATAVKDALEPKRPEWHLRGGESVRSRLATPAMR